MNIREFKEGDLVTRNKPMVYAHNNSADGSYLGDRMLLIGVDEASQIIFLKDTKASYLDSPIDLSYARDAWDEGWVAYPETLYQINITMRNMKSCFWGHEWGKWKETGRADKKYSPNFGPNKGQWFVDGFVVVQERACGRCGKVQVERQEVSASV